MAAVIEHEKQTVNLTKELEDEPQRLKEEKKKVLNSRLYSLLELFQFFTKAEFSEEEGRASVSWLPLMLSRFSPRDDQGNTLLHLAVNYKTPHKYLPKFEFPWSSWMQESVLMPSTTMEIPRYTEP